MNERATGHRGDRRVNWRPTDGGVRIFEEGDSDAWVEVAFDAGVPPEKRLFSICPACGFVSPQRTGPGRGMVCGECDAELDRE